MEHGENVSSEALPVLLWHAFKGNLEEVLDCITGKYDLDQYTSIINHHGQVVDGVTALFLAAQGGHLDIVRLLVENGAVINTSACIRDSNALCTPIQVAKLNMHIQVYWYLTKREESRSKSDGVLNSRSDVIKAVKKLIKNYKLDE